MTTPANFYGNSSYASFNEAYGHAKTTSTISFDAISNQNVGRLWVKNLSAFAPNVAKIVVKETGKTPKIVATGVFIAPKKFITCAHTFDLFGDCFYLITHDEVEIKVAVKDGYINKERDFAIFPISHPSKELTFPPIANPHNFSSQLAMLHYCEDSEKPLVSIGDADTMPYRNFRPLCNIDGTNSSSGSVLLNENGEMSMLHISRKKEFTTLRVQIHLEDILSEEAAFRLNQDNYVDKKEDYEWLSATPCQCDEIFEHGLFKSNIDEKSDPVFFSKEVFKDAKKLVGYAIKNNIHVYTKMFESPKNLLRADVIDSRFKDLRLDIQPQAPKFANLHIQNENKTIAGILVSEDLSNYGKSPHLITATIKFAFGNLINCLSMAEETQRIHMAKIELKK